MHLGMRLGMRFPNQFFLRRSSSYPRQPVHNFAAPCFAPTSSQRPSPAMIPFLVGNWLGK